jgi:hypothetical protein
MYKEYEFPMRDNIKRIKISPEKKYTLVILNDNWMDFYIPSDRNGWKFPFSLISSIVSKIPTFPYPEYPVGSVVLNVVDTNGKIQTGIIKDVNDIQNASEIMIEVNDIINFNNFGTMKFLVFEK